MMPVKTTFDLPEPLVADVKRIARARGTTARELVRQALVRLVDEDTPGAGFTLPDMSVAGGYPDLDPVTLNRLILDTYDEPRD